MTTQKEIRAYIEQLKAENYNRMNGFLDDVRETGNPEAVKQLMVFGDSFERLPWLLKCVPHIERNLLYKTLGEHWTGFDNIGIYKKNLIPILRRATDAERSLMMDADDRRTFDALPSIVTVWRGCYPHNRLGLSWSLSRDIAVKFVSGMNRYTHSDKTPLLLSARIRKSGLVTKVGRDEQEVIIPHKIKFTAESLTQEKGMPTTASPNEHLPKSYPQGES